MTATIFADGHINTNDDDGDGNYGGKDTAASDDDGYGSDDDKGINNDETIP